MKARFNWQNSFQRRNRGVCLTRIYGRSDCRASQKTIFRYVTLKWADGASTLMWKLQHILICSVLFAASAFSVKLSLFLLYFRLFQIQNVTRWLIYSGIIVCGLFYSGMIIASCALYIPPPDHQNTSLTWWLRAWKADDVAHRLLIVQGSFGTMSDIYLLVIPIRSIFQLQLPIRRRLGISSIFLIGIMWVISF